MANRFIEILTEMRARLVNKFTLITEEQVDKTEPGPEIIPGTEKSKDVFTGEQKKQAGFAVRMEAAVKQMKDLEDAGFNPVNLYDLIVNNLPFDPRALENWLSSAEYKQYNRAKFDFATAQLRQETGAVINDSEIIWIEQTYFPNFGDDEETLRRKREARDAALAAMIGQAGKAYDRTKAEIISRGGLTLESESALEILKKRAKTDAKLRQKLIEKGLIDE
jgi:hypothetical protein